MNEFDFIATFLSPLAHKEKGALGLKDDAAVLQVPLGHELVITKDALIEGVHFLATTSAQSVARKALRVNLSDLAAMGARPWGYFLGLMLPDSIHKKWLTDFTSGLKRDQQEFGITLMGGDTTRTPGPLTLSITALGLVRKGQALTRSGAKPNDAIYVSGTIGDSALGLIIAQQKSDKTPFLKQRYDVPEPRLKLGQALGGIATSCMDISDGLMQDLGHICTASRVGAEITWSAIPLSEEAKSMLAAHTNPHAIILAGGDDYELLFTAPANAEKKLRAIAKIAHTSITRIGHITKGSRLKALDEKGKEIMLKSSGYRHF